MAKIKLTQKEEITLLTAIVLGACMSYFGGMSANLAIKLFDISKETGYIMYGISTIALIGILVWILLRVYRIYKGKEKKPEWDEHRAFIRYKSK